MSFHMGLDPSVMRCGGRKAIPMSTPSDTQFRSIVDRWSQIVLDWEISSVVVCDPLSCVAESGAGNPFVPTALAFATAPFRFWAGDLTYCVEIMSSPLIRWRIGVVIIPPGVAEPFVFPTGGEYVSYVIEVSGSTCEEFTVPYLYYDQFQDSQFNDVLDSDIARTRLKWFSLTDPLGPATTPVFPYINLYVKAGPNFTVGVPSLEKVDEWKIVNQSGGIGDESLATFGEVVDDMMLLTRRSTPWLEVPCFAVDTITMPVRPLVPTDAATVLGFINTNFRWTYSSWLSQAYLGEVGSYDTKYSLRTVGTEDNSGPYLARVTLGTLGPALLGGASGSYSDGAAHFRFGQSPMIEVHSPDKTINFFRPAVSRDFNLNVRSIWGISLEGRFTVDDRLSVWSAGADDYDIGGFIFPKKMYRRGV
jgi:hypothetical protein